MVRQSQLHLHELYCVLCGLKPPNSSSDLGNTAVIKAMRFLTVICCFCLSVSLAQGGMLRRAAALAARQLQQAAAAVDAGLPSTSAPISVGGIFSGLLNTFRASPTGPSNVAPLLPELVRTKYTYAFKRAANMPGLIFWPPRTPGQRHKITIDYKGLGIYTGLPHPDLSMRKKRSGGRNSHGRVTVRGRGGGFERIIRKVDYSRRDHDGNPLPPGIVERIEYDPNRSAFLALVRYDTMPPISSHSEQHLTDNLAPTTSSSGSLSKESFSSGQQSGSSQSQQSRRGRRQPPGVEFRYHVAPDGLRVGDVIQCGEDAPIRPGSCLPLRHIPLGVDIHNIELVPGKGGIMARAAGTGAVIQFKEEKYAVLRLPSGEVRRVDLDCTAVVGTVSNHLQRMLNKGKAGTNRQMGRRPKVRGVAMNPIDHPHGGRSYGGRPSCTPWGIYCKGQRTRLRNKWTNKYIITRAGGQPIEKFVNAKKWRAAAERERKAKSGNTAHLKPAQGVPLALLGPRPPAWGQIKAVAKG